jgi:hypothetical protein
MGKGEIHEKRVACDRSEVLSDEASLLFPIPYLLEEMGHVDFLRLHLHHPRVFEHAPGRRSSRALFLKTAQEVSNVQSSIISRYVPALDKVLEVFSPFDTVLGLVLKFWDRLSNNVG